VTLLDGEDAQIHSADKFPMSRGNSCPRFCHGYGADTRFGLRSRRLAPRSCVYCKQSTANKSTANKSTANNPMQTIQCKQSNCHPERSEGSRFLRRGFDYVREFSLHTVTDGPPRAEKRTNRGCPRKRIDIGEPDWFIQSTNVLQYLHGKCWARGPSLALSRMRPAQSPSMTNCCRLRSINHAHVWRIGKRERPASRRWTKSPSSP
jgi:hypothetical protein